MQTNSLHTIKLIQIIGFFLDSFHMEGKALVWFQDLEASGTITSWDGFVQALQTRFGPTSYEDPVEALTHLRQTSIIEHYNSQFDHLSNQL